MGIEWDLPVSELTLTRALTFQGLQQRICFLPCFQSTDSTLCLSFFLFSASPLLTLLPLFCLVFLTKTIVMVLCLTGVLLAMDIFTFGAKLPPRHRIWHILSFFWLYYRYFEERQGIILPTIFDDISPEILYSTFTLLMRIYQDNNTHARQSLELCKIVTEWFILNHARPCSKRIYPSILQEMLLQP